MLLFAVMYNSLLCNFKGANSDELDITENEQLEVFGESEGDGWIRVSLFSQTSNSKSVLAVLNLVTSVSTIFDDDSS